MNLWQFLTLIIIASIIGGIAQSWIKSRQGQASSQQENEQHQQALAALEERIKTLEAIVTDSKYDLNREFENLQQKEKV